MRRIVLFDQITLDGYFSTPDGKLDWAVQDEQIHADGAAGTVTTDTVLFGRRTYEMFASFWPHALDASPTAPDPHGGPRSASMRTMAVFLNETPKIVFSRTLERASWHNTRVIRELDPREVAAMKEGPDDKRMIIFGSGSIVTLLTQHGLIDDYELVVAPVLLGGGRRLFGELAARTRLELVEAKAFASGAVRLRYTRARG